MAGPLHPLKIASVLPPECHEQRRATGGSRTNTFQADFDCKCTVKMASPWHHFMASQLRIPWSSLPSSLCSDLSIQKAVSTHFTISWAIPKLTSSWLCPPPNQWPRIGCLPHGRCATPAATSWELWISALKKSCWLIVFIDFSNFLNMLINVYSFVYFYPILSLCIFLFCFTWSPQFSSLLRGTCRLRTFDLAGGIMKLATCNNTHTHILYVYLYFIHILTIK